MCLETAGFVIKRFYLYYENHPFVITSNIIRHTYSSRDYISQNHISYCNSRCMQVRARQIAASSENNVIMSVHIRTFSKLSSGILKSSLQDQRNMDMRAERDKGHLTRTWKWWLAMLSTLPIELTGSKCSTSPQNVSGCKSSYCILQLSWIFLNCSSCT